MRSPKHPRAFPLCEEGLHVSSKQLLTSCLLKQEAGRAPWLLAYVARAEAVILRGSCLLAAWTPASRSRCKPALLLFLFYNLVSGLGNPRKTKWQHLEYSGATSRLFDATIEYGAARTASEK